MPSTPSAGPSASSPAPAPGRRRRSRIASQIRSRAGLFAPTRSSRCRSRTRPRARCAARLDELGVPGVRCSTFHSAALGQLRFFAAEPPQRILASKALPLRHIGNTLRRPYRFRPAADLATEIEWAKNRRITPDDYLALARRPRAADPVRSHAARLPRVRAAQGRAGLGRLRGPARADDPALRRGRGRARAGARPLPRVHGRRVPGRQPPPADAPRPLARRPGRAVRGRRRLPVDLRVHGREPRATCSSMPRRFPSATVVRLEENYRSTPEVLEFANRLVPRLGGAEKVLRATRPAGPEPVARSFGAPELEAGFLVERIRELAHERDAVRGDGDPLPDERALGRLRGGAERGGDPVAGRGAPLTGRARGSS